MTLNFSSTYIWYITLGKVSVSINFALSHSEVLVVLVLSWWILKERFVIHKAIVLLILIPGLVMVAVGKANSSYSEQSEVEGIILVFLATLLWGFYEVIYKRHFGMDVVNSIVLERFDAIDVEFGRGSFLARNHVCTNSGRIGTILHWRNIGTVVRLFRR